MKKTIICVVTCLALLMASAQASTVQAQAPGPEEDIINQFPEIIEERPYFEPPEYYFTDDMPEGWGWHQRHFEESEKREFIPPTEESLRLTQQQVQAFDCGTVTDVPQVECEALVSLYESTNGAGWTDNTNWLQSTTVGNWKGITVYEGQVGYIRLQENNLTGTIPASLGNLLKLLGLYLDRNQLTGTIPATISNLVYLKSLSLNGNHLTGMIPTWIGNLENLLSLTLSHNQFTGMIPAELGNLADLMYLSLAGNQLTGTIPATLGNPENIFYLNLGRNRLTGTIPVELSNLPNLQILYLDWNQLTGSIPTELSNLDNILYLGLSGNQLTGAIPSELSNLASLMGLGLDWNRLTGTIPVELGTLVKLIHLDLSHNLLEGDVPDSFTNLTNLCVDGQPEENCHGYSKTDIGYNLLNVPQPNPPSDFLYEKDPDWDQTQGVKGVFPGATGGTLVSNDERTTVTVPIGAVDEDLTLILKPIPPASGFTLPFVSASNNFELQAFDANGEVTQFNQPLVFTLKYSDQEIGSMPEESLALHYYDINSERWLDAITTCPSGNYTRNPDQNQFSLPVCHLTDFAVVGEGLGIYLPTIFKQ